MYIIKCISFFLRFENKYLKYQKYDRPHNFTAGRSKTSEVIAKVLSRCLNVGPFTLLKRHLLQYSDLTSILFPLHDFEQKLYNAELPISLATCFQTVHRYRGYDYHTMIWPISYGPCNFILIIII